MAGPVPPGRGRTAAAAPVEIDGREIVAAPPTVDGRLIVGREIVAGRDGL
jgi:hypothetical protein